MTTVDIEHLLRNDELLQLLDAAEQGGSLKAAELADVVETHELDALEQDALYRELDRRGIEVVVDEPKEEEPPPAPAPAAVVQETTTDALQLFLREAGRHALLTAAQEVELAKKIEQRRHAREAADDPVEPAPRRLDREELPQPGPALPRPDPGGDARADPRRREVRLAPRLQVLDLRDLVDPAGGRTRARRQGAHDPDAGAHRRAAAEDEPRRADALDAARPRADARGDRRGGLPAAAAGDRGARGGAGVDEPRPARRRGRGRRLRRLRRRRRARCPRSRSSSRCAARRSRRRSERSRSASGRSSCCATGSPTPSRRRSRRSAAGSG